MRKAAFTNKICKRCENLMEHVGNGTVYCCNCRVISRKEYLKEHRKTYVKGKNPRKVKDKNSNKIGVYVVYDKYNTIIYVGRTSDISKRMGRHRKQGSEWLNEQHRVEFIEYITFGDSLVAEAILIRDNKPKYNKDGVIR